MIEFVGINFCLQIFTLFSYVVHPIFRNVCENGQTMLLYYWFMSKCMLGRGQMESIPAGNACKFKTAYLQYVGLTQ